MSAELTIAGIAPREVIAPRDLAELAAAVGELYAANRAFAFVGGGTDLELGNPPRTLDAVVRTTALDRVLAYSPEDQTITVGAGMTLASVDAVLAEHDQLLPIDAGDRERATVGGAIAINAFGARRQRYGSIKDLILGVEIVRPDGTRAHGGGRVVKNVAGFDLPKLMVGSLGTLGAIASATFRVFPRPRASAIVIIENARTPPGELDVVVALTAAEQLEITAIVRRNDGIAMHHRVLIEGDPDAVAAQVARLIEVAGPVCSAARLAGQPDLDVLAGWEHRFRAERAWRTRTVTPPLGTGSSDALCYPALGVAFSAGDDDLEMSLDDVAERVAVTRREAGGALIFHAMPQRWRDAIDAWGDPPPSLPIMRALKTNFDPKGLCNPGRFVGGL